MADFSVNSKPYIKAESGSLPLKIIKDIKIIGDYVYVCGRGNGSGLNNDIVFPMLYFPFEGNSLDDNTNVLGFDSYVHSGNASIDNSGEPSPFRFQHSAKLYKGNGEGAAILRKSFNFNNSGQFYLWIKNLTDILSDSVYIPLLENLGSPVLSIIIGSDKKLGLQVNGTDYYSDISDGNNWINIKIIISNSSIAMYVRSKEQDINWGNAIITQSIVGVTADTICCGIETNADTATIFIDDLAFDTANIDSKISVNGFLSVLRKDDLTLVKTFSSGLRCLSMIEDEGLLYLGMIGGLNVYNISNPSSPTLVSYNRESNRSWTYPADNSGNYHYTVRGEETQRLAITTDSNNRYVIGSGDVNGVIIYKKVLDSIILIKKDNDIPSVPVIVHETGVETRWS